MLSEIPAEWYRAIRSWHALNRDCKTEHRRCERFPVGRRSTCFYQTLVGVWPLKDADRREHEERYTTACRLICGRRCAKPRCTPAGSIPTSLTRKPWTGSSRAALERWPENRFLPEFISFVEKIKAAGMWNSLSQTLLKIASPGVPDFYQGNEIWDFSLVDPDNRRPVDYEVRRQTLDRLRKDAADPPALIDRLASNPADGALKLFVISRALCFRKSNRDLLEEGAYIPLRASGARQNHVIAFARNRGGKSLLAIASRFFMALGAERRKPTGEDVWGDSVLKLRQDLARTVWRDVFSAMYHRDGSAKRQIHAAPGEGVRALARRPAVRRGVTAAMWSLRYGANVRPSGVEFRLWAPRLRGVQVAIGDDPGRILAMHAKDDGEFAVFADGLQAGADYTFLTNGGRQLPDPVSRWQPRGVHGPSRVVDPAAFVWSDAAWRGLPLRRLPPLRTSHRNVYARRHIREHRAASRSPSRPGCHGS